VWRLPIHNGAGVDKACALDGFVGKMIADGINSADCGPGASLSSQPTVTLGTAPVGSGKTVNQGEVNPPPCRDLWRANRRRRR